MDWGRAGDQAAIDRGDLQACRPQSLLGRCRAPTHGDREGEPRGAGERWNLIALERLAGSWSQGGCRLPYLGRCSPSPNLSPRGEKEFCRPPPGMVDESRLGRGDLSPSTRNVPGEIPDRHKTGGWSARFKLDSYPNKTAPCGL